MNIRILCIALTFTLSSLLATTPILDVQAVLLAAGKSKRFNSATSKVLAHVQFKPMIVHAIQPLHDLHIPIILVVGHQRDLVKKAVDEAGIDNIQYAVQEEALGTGHAVSCAQPYWTKNNILITYGDMPLINTEIITQLYETHMKEHADLTLILASNIDPACTYGRIVKIGNDIRIVEKKHFTMDIKDHPLVNAGIYLVKREVLEMCLPQIERNAVSQEYYFTDILEIANKKNLRIATIVVPFDAVRGVNTQEEYLQVKQLVEGCTH